MRIVFIILLATGFCRAEVSALMARGYTVLPYPQQVELNGGDFRFEGDWKLELSGVRPQDSAVMALQEELDTRFHMKLAAQAQKSIRLVMAADSVTIGTALSRDKAKIAAQAYRLELSPNRIQITANAMAGLFYGVETLVQLMRPRDGAATLPEGRITDWPDLDRRHLYWDDAHHLDRLEELKRAVRQAAFFKINGFALKLEGHFQFKSAPAVVEPYALTAAQFQELTSYGLRYHVQVIPYIDAPAHVAFILKHPEYAKLRAFPESNYEICATNPDSYKLLTGMYQDLLDANKGVDYFYLSTDEAYYIGMANHAQCNEEAEAKRLGSPGKLLASFLEKAATYLHERGRTVIFWGEFPMRPTDVASVPSWLVNGEVNGPQFDKAWRAQGIRQTIYTATQGEERLFPDYYLAPSQRRLHPGRNGTPRVESGFRTVARNTARENSDLFGMIVAGWGDSGLHPSTFWLGYATIAAAGWNPLLSSSQELTATFLPLYYGREATGMQRIYQLLAWQAQFWADSWEPTNTSARKGIWGNSDQIHKERRPARDQTLPLPPVPAKGDLSISGAWSQDNARRLQLATLYQGEIEELTGLLYENLMRADQNRYSVEVLLSIANICRQNVDFLLGLGQIQEMLTTAHSEAASKQARRAVQALDRALDRARVLTESRDAVLAETTKVWEKSWHPRVAEANGRKLLHQHDDVKDHIGDRTIDLSYLVQRQLLLGVDDWRAQLKTVRDAYAAANNVTGGGRGQ